MKKYLLLGICIFISILTTGCGTSDFMPAAMNSWLGYSLNDVIAQWGYPTDEKNIVDKHLVYWSRKWMSYVQQGSSDHYNNGYYKEYFCTRILEIDKDKKIIGWQWEGNGCPFGYSRGKRMVNPQNNQFVSEEQKIKAKIEASKHVGGSMKNILPKNYIDNISPQDKKDAIEFYNHSEL